MSKPETLYWQDKFDELTRTELDTVRATAGKWQATIGTLLGIFGSVAFVGGISKVNDLDDWSALWSKRLIIAAVLLALAAVLGAAYAAQGLPRDKRNLDARTLQTESPGQARKALGALRISQGLALAATACVVFGGLIVLVAEDREPGPANFLITSNGEVWCADLVATQAGHQLESSGQVIAVPDMARITEISSCPESTDG